MEKSDNNCKCSLRIKNLGVKKDGGEILYNVSFQVHHAEITALIGRNGAGKTTLLKAILGRIPYTGSIDFYNSNGEKVLKPQIGYVPQNTMFDRTIPMTVGDFLCANAGNSPVWLFHNKHSMKKAIDTLKKIGGENLIPKPMSALSGGEMQRVLLAFALDPMPDLLLLDEPVSAVDMKGIESFYETVTSLRKEYHMPVILVSHNLSHVKKYATDVVLLEKTVILSGSTNEVMHSKQINDTFGLI